jgi:hypothetical protein
MKWLDASFTDRTRLALVKHPAAVWGCLNQPALRRTIFSLFVIGASGCEDRPLAHALEQLTAVRRILTVQAEGFPIGSRPPLLS